MPVAEKMNARLGGSFVVGIVREEDLRHDGIAAGSLPCARLLTLGRGLRVEPRDVHFRVPSASFFLRFARPLKVAFMSSVNPARPAPF